MFILIGKKINFNFLKWDFFKPGKIYVTVSMAIWANPSQNIYLHQQDFSLHGCDFSLV